MSTQYCSYSVLPPKGKRTTARRSCKKTANASEDSELCELMNNRCGLKTSHDHRVWTHEHPKTSKGKTAKKAVKRSAVKKSLAPPAPDAKLLKFLESSKRRSVVPELSDERRRMDSIRLGECTPRTDEECETEMPKDCRWDKGRNDGKGLCVKDSTRAVDGLSARRREERTKEMNEAEVSYQSDRAFPVGKVLDS